MRYVALVMIVEAFIINAWGMTGTDRDRQITAAVVHQFSLAPYLRETADVWNAGIERWTYVTRTPLARSVGVEGYYVRIARRARVEQVKRQLEADILEPARAKMEAEIADAQGHAAKIIEEGKG